ncbi:class I SAM-dependent DNA methyltransferase [Clostridium oryzae]|uniref:Ubiquinone/menaquinone biosynthesis C-methyltransferase UbiE n=1 Tax=Clostridium oryzae TaxID=1450648 RepID=A0A1V4IJ72_9CLOT|nr:class I SAM-dependent methyltransferase [Clostridium oryzae]OPJ60048.1 ubiquinone/menaquinone biosynthesis C-methyltransferase UbiE [Clostridium oryzae]
MSFDEQAKSWDTDKRIKRAKVIADEIVKSIDIDENYSAMEFGCGTGLVSFNLYDKFKHITLIDSSKGMIEILKDKINNHKIQNMTAKHLYLENEKVIDERYDVIYNSMVLHHIKDTKKIVEIFYGLLNDNGYLVIVDLDEEDGTFHKNESGFDGHNGFNQHQMKDIFGDVGFTDVEINTFFHGEKEIDGEIIKYSLFLAKGKK